MIVGDLPHSVRILLWKNAISGKLDVMIVRDIDYILIHGSIRHARCGSSRRNGLAEYKT